MPAYNGDMDNMTAAQKAVRLKVLEARLIADARLYGERCKMKQCQVSDQKVSGGDNLTPANPVAPLLARISRLAR